jgi:hypothetical protein
VQKELKFSFILNKIYSNLRSLSCVACAEKVNLLAVCFMTLSVSRLYFFLLLVGRHWVPRYLVQVPRYLLVPGTAATLAYCTNSDDRWGCFLEQLVEWNLAGETEVLGENLPRRHFVHHKIPHNRPGLDPRTAAVGSQRLTLKLWRGPSTLYSANGRVIDEW